MAAALKGMQVVAATDVTIIDEDLGNGATAVAAPGDHRVARPLIAIDGVFGVRDTFSIKQVLGTDAEGTEAPGVDLDLAHLLRELFPVSAAG